MKSKSESEYITHKEFEEFILSQTKINLALAQAIALMSNNLENLARREEVNVPVSKLCS